MSTDNPSNVPVDVQEWLARNEDPAFNAWWAENGGPGSSFEDKAFARVGWQIERAAEAGTAEGIDAVAGAMKFACGAAHALGREYAADLRDYAVAVHAVATEMAQKFAKVIDELKTVTVPEFAARRAKYEPKGGA